MMSKLKKIDYAGSLISLAATIFILVRHTFEIDSFSGTGEWRWCDLLLEQSSRHCPPDPGRTSFHIICRVRSQVCQDPNHAKYLTGNGLLLMVVHLFTIRSVALILFQTFFVGVVYYGNLYYLPIYSQVLLRRSIITSGVLLLPLIITQTATATLAGLILAK